MRRKKEDVLFWVVSLFLAAGFILLIFAVFYNGTSDPPGLAQENFYEPSPSGGPSKQEIKIPEEEWASYAKFLDGQSTWDWED